MKKIILSLVAFVSLVFADTDYNFATELEKKMHKYRHNK